MKFNKKTLGIAFVLSVVTLGILTGCGEEKKANENAPQTAKKTVKVAHTPHYVPYDFVNDKGESDGFEVAVLKEVAGQLPQYEFEFI